MNKNKTIFIDGLGLVDGHFSGIGQYIYGILKAMDDIVGDAKYHNIAHPDICVVIPYDSIGKFNSFGFKHIRYKRFPLSFRIMSGMWYRGKMPPIDIWCGKGTYLFTRFVSMPLLFSKSALIIYDISFELYRQYSDEKNAEFLSNAVKRSLKETQKVITISENARREIVDYYKINPDLVCVATPATDPRIFYRRNREQIDDAKRKYGIKGDYILALSNLEPRKNLEGLVEAYCNLPQSIRDKNSLLLVGVSGWKTDKLFKDIVERVKSGYDIIRPSEYVLDEDKPAIISGAKMLVYPSHYEGFGMPPLEALACGVPVITADNSSLPEVMGDAGAMVSSDNTVKLRKQIESYLSNYDDISKKAIEAGPSQATRFSWKKSAETILKELEDIRL